MIEDKQYKVVMLGSGAVGKSAITVQMVSGHFLSSYDPTIEDSYRTTININNKDIILNIIDTAGQEEFYALRDQYMRSGDGYIIVFSITSVTSFLEVTAIKEQLNMVLDVDNNTLIPIILVGNKCDLEEYRQVQSSDAQRLAEEWRVKYFETSAKNKTNINRIFEELVYLIEANNQTNIQNTSNQNIENENAEIENTEIQEDTNQNTQDISDLKNEKVFSDTVKEIKVVNEYPATEENGVLYIKLES